MSDRREQFVKTHEAAALCSQKRGGRRGERAMWHLRTYGVEVDHCAGLRGATPPPLITGVVQACTRSRELDSVVSPPIFENRTETCYHNCAAPP